MKWSFAGGIAAGVLVVLAGALVYAARREPIAGPEPAASQPPAHKPADTTSGELAAARARIGVLESEIAQAKRQAASKVASTSRVEAIVKRLGGVIPDGTDDEEAYEKLRIRLQVFIADLAEEKGLGLDEASVDPGMGLAFVAAFMDSTTPPLTAEQRAKLEALKESYVAEWNAYLQKRDSMLGVERCRVLQRLVETASASVGDIVGEEGEDAIGQALGVWNSVSMLRGGGLNPYREMPDDELIAKIGEDWGNQLGLRPDQQEAVPALVGDYIRVVRAARSSAGASSDPKNHDIEEKAMIEIQNRMVTTLRLDQDQLARLRTWSMLPGIDGGGN